MSKAAQELKDRLRKLLKPPIITLDGDVTAVNEADYTCTIQLPEGTQLPGVQLKALKGKTDCIVTIPTVGTTAQIINLGKPDWMMISCDQVDKLIITAAVKVQIICDDVELNGGDNKGMVILEELKSNLDSLKTYCEALKSATAAGIDGVSGGYGATGKTTFNTAMAGQTISFGNMENTKVKH